MNEEGLKFDTQCPGAHFHHPSHKDRIPKSPSNQRNEGLLRLPRSGRTTESPFKSSKIRGSCRLALGLIKTCSQRNEATRNASSAIKDYEAGSSNTGEPLREGRGTITRFSVTLVPSKLLANLCPTQSPAFFTEHRATNPTWVLSDPRLRSGGQSSGFTS